MANRSEPEARTDASPKPTKSPTPPSSSLQNKHGSARAPSSTSTARHTRIDSRGAISLRRAGRMHHIGIGRAHKHQPVIVIIDDLNIRVIHTTTGELLRALTLDPTRGYQPRFKT